MSMDDLKIIKNGTAEIISEEELLHKLSYNRPLIVKYGADPSAPDLHLGHYVCFRKLKELQDLGHKIVFIIGDFTAQIGDPSGRNKTRKMLTPEQTAKNSKTYLDQVFKILNREKTIVRYNSEWLKNLDFRKIADIASRYTVARMLERDDFEKRYKSQQPISILEFLYPLLVAYDSVIVEADIELGGTDQKFNLLAGRHMQQEYGIEPQIAITLPILPGLDGVRKMSKSLGNYIAFSDTPEDMYGKTMSIPDSVIDTYLNLVLGLNENDMEKIRKEIYAEKGENPKFVKEYLAKEIVKIFYEDEDADRAQKHFNTVFKKKEIPDNIEEYKTHDGTWIVKILTDSKTVSSSSEARRLIKQGAVKIDGEQIRDINYNVMFDDKSKLVLKVGKRRFLKIVKE
ncbi:tyrosine--tRNA ligase [candidate division TA06 bacterium]|jgi:tyrosyl-tRNA synthetase|uniref:Tyrosine--tRNA ligase n=1 Tax=candidate division TA06 bacterium TaxID=2250710 RepID=A0A660SAZ6_UNCT6|nr:MAG: tyrosine--tRNA ligase [candidate division TA06 bacterium]